MDNRVMYGVLLGLLFSFNVFAQPVIQLQPQWQIFFDEHTAEGTIVVLDERGGDSRLKMYNENRSQQRLPPASTFNIPHALFALDAGLIQDEFQIFPWDGVRRSFAAHNQDQTLRSSMRNSAVWVYEWFAEQIGTERAREYLTRIQYGNNNSTGDTRTYWIDGNLLISAQEQIHFLKQLYQNNLPFDKADQRLVKDLMIVEAGREWILRAKTGWDGKTGWWVGWVEWPTGPVFFALNIDTPHRLEDLYKREAITRQVLRSIKALPPD